ncbi:hypothetical protein DLM46_04140 [Paraburkholderia lacunae]|uniref:Uncharacterized protein n=2 Tax=Paraburkholderia lacunae TaxID=2211104 RepID=A0A370NEZ6_9BURK|nr:hypothetical protein DLM46_04140 [Paraburkholderia lacunae]
MNDLQMHAARPEHCTIRHSDDELADAGAVEAMDVWPESQCHPFARYYAWGSRTKAAGNSVRHRGSGS